ncbi:hypothetical protein F2Q69_00014889 [Brassica cretica]|uniref:Uncharacterized protein n=1 Tax=Brassica cretica TaxID=69181 RepID=A0A8S9R8Z8_BRACR|nr:hypothetical protein F2Q69_00014889 [Brassica cretica]
MKKRSPIPVAKASDCCKGRGGAARLALLLRNLVPFLSFSSSCVLALVFREALSCKFEAFWSFLVQAREDGGKQLQQASYCPGCVEMWFKLSLVVSIGEDCYWKARAVEPHH